MGPLLEGDAQLTRTVVSEGSRELPGTVVNQSLDGKVYIQFDGMDGVRRFAVSTIKDRWAGSQVADHPLSAATGTSWLRFPYQLLLGSQCEQRAGTCSGRPTC